MQPDTDTKPAGSGKEVAIRDGETSSLPKKSIKQATDETIDVPSELAVALTDKEINQAAKALGATRIKASKFRGLRDIGEMLKRHGAVQVAVGQWLLNNDLRDTLIQFCIERMQQIDSIEDFNSVVQSVNNLLNAKDTAAKQIVDSVKSGHFKEQPQQPQNRFPKPGQQVIGQQLNVLVQRKEADE